MITPSPNTMLAGLRGDTPKPSVSLHQGEQESLKSKHLPRYVGGPAGDILNLADIPFRSQSRSRF